MLFLIAFYTYAPHKFHLVGVIMQQVIGDSPRRIQNTIIFVTSSRKTTTRHINPLLASNIHCILVSPRGTR